MNKGTHSLIIKTAQTANGENGQFVTGTAAIKFYANKEIASIPIRFVAFRKVAMAALAPGNIIAAVGKFTTLEIKAKKDPDYLLEISQAIVVGQKPLDAAPAQPVVITTSAAPSATNPSGEELDF
jgi:hypothetical protein